jgi:hypothetical protein
VLRILGPLVGVLTFAVLISGIVLFWGPPGWHSRLLFLHKASFILWFGAMVVHVLGHLVHTYRLAPRDWTPHTSWVPGAWLRRLTLLASLVAGVGLGLLALGQVDNWVR